MEITKRLKRVIAEWMPRILEFIKREAPPILDATNRRIRPVLARLRQQIPYIRRILAKRAPFILDLAARVAHYFQGFMEEHFPLVKDRFMSGRHSPLLVIGLVGILIIVIGGYTSDTNESNADGVQLSDSTEQSQRDYDKEFEEAAADTAYGTAAITTTNTMTFNTLMGW